MPPLVLFFFLIFAFHSIISRVLIDSSALLNNICIESTPLSEWSFAYQAIVCGTPLQNGQLKSDLISTGLIHLIVVSGSHLIFLASILEKLLKALPRNHLIIGFILFLFTLTTNLQPPSVRALVSLALGRLSKNQKLFWTNHQQVLISGIFTLIFFPHWVLSLSFVMSWGAGFALASNPFQSGQVRHHIWVFLVLFPIFLPLAPLNPISIITNALFAPIIGAILFPLSLLAFLFPLFTYITDGLWNCLEFTLRIISSNTHYNFESIPYGIWWLWAYIFLVHIFSQVRQVINKRCPNV